MKDQSVVEILDVLRIEVPKFDIPFNDKERVGKLSNETRRQMYINSYKLLKIEGSMTAHEMQLAMKKNKGARRYASNYMRVRTILSEMDRLGYLVSKSIRINRMVVKFYNVKEDAK